MSSMTVLVGIVGEDKPRITQFAKILEKLDQNGETDVLLTHIYSQDDLDQIEEMYDVDVREPHHLSAAAEHNTAINELAELLDERNIDNDVRGGLGEPGAELINIATELRPDFLLIGGRKRTATGKALFGSTAQRVLMNAPCAVIFAGPAAE